MFATTVTAKAKQGQFAAVSSGGFGSSATTTTNVFVPALRTVEDIGHGSSSSHTRNTSNSSTRRAAPEYFSPSGSSQQIQPQPPPSSRSTGHQNGECNPTCQFRLRARRHRYLICHCLRRSEVEAMTLLWAMPRTIRGQSSRYVVRYFSSTILKFIFYAAVSRDANGIHCVRYLKCSIRRPWRVKPLGRRTVHDHSRGHTKPDRWKDPTVDFVQAWGYREPPPMLMCRVLQRIGSTNIGWCILYCVRHALGI